MLTDTFLQLVLKHSPSHELANNLWLEIFTRYSEPKRFYHSVAHLENLYAEIIPVKGEISDWDAVMFALFYHDIIYKASGTSNEEDSAAVARKRLSEIGFPPERSERCAEMILATKKHEWAHDNDTNLLTDADLSILGADTETYRKYTEEIRKEYSIYPDFLYSPGRKKVVQYFLQMERIFKTDYFYRRYETQARQNLATELQDLNS